MKKICIFVLMVLSIASCSTFTKVTTLEGSITVFNASCNDVIRKYNNIVIEEVTQVFDNNGNLLYTKNDNALKSFGLNFYDKEKDNFVLISSTIPYIIEYNSSSTEKSSSDIKQDNLSTAESIKVKYINYQKQVDENKKKMKSLDKKSAEYKIMKEQNDKLRSEMGILNQEYLHLTGNYIYQYF
jgi:hypothetical protein